MAESVTLTRSKTKLSPAYSGWERVDVSWTSGPGGIASDTISLCGAVQEVCTVPSADDPPVGGYDLQLLDVDNSDVDFLNAQCASRSSDAVEFAECLVSSVLPVAVVGDCVFKVTAADSDMAGEAIFLLRN